MGTTDTKALKKCLSDLLDRLGWSQKRLAREVYWATFDDDDPVEIKRLEESLKKEMQRSSTKPERLEEYINIISRHPEFEKLDVVLPFYIPRSGSSADFDREMKNISREITKSLEKSR